MAYRSSPTTYVTRREGVGLFSANRGYRPTEGVVSSVDRHFRRILERLYTPLDPRLGTRPARNNGTARFVDYDRMCSGYVSG